MTKKNLNFQVIALALMLSIPGIYCTKHDASSSSTQEQGATEKTVTLSKQSSDSSQTSSALLKKTKSKSEKEKPLSIVSMKTSSSSTTLSSSPIQCYGMAYGESYTPGYYTYPAQSMNFADNLSGTVTLDLHAYGVPNRFRVMHPNNYTIAVSEWFGDVSYEGPWGSELHTDNGTLSFQVTSTDDYTLIVETQVDDVSDYWEAQTSCTPPQNGGDINSLSNQQIIDIYSNIGAPHNEGLDYVLNNLKTYYGPVYTGSNSKAAHDAMYQKIDEYLKSYMMTKCAVGQSDADSCIANFQNSPVTSSGSSLSTNITYSPYYSSMSSAFINAVAQLNTLVHDTINCYTKTYYDNIVSNNISLLPTNYEKVNLVSMCSVGYSSMTYWKDSISKWQTFFGNTSIGFNCNSPALLTVALSLSTIFDNYYFLNSPARDIGVADISGIVYGAAYGCAWGAMGVTIALPVVGTVTGCAGVGAISALGGGLGNSAKKAIESFFDWLTS